MKNFSRRREMLCPFKSFSLLTIFLLSSYFAQAFHITYTVDKTSGCKDLVVAFTNTTVDTTGKIYIWDYQDGTNKDTSYHATHTFTTPGTYTVILTQDSAGTTFNSLGNGSTITVNGSSGSFFSSPTTACPEQSVSFYSNDNYTSLNWNFGDGSQNETWNWVSHSYSDTGTYVVTLIEAHSCGIDTITQNYVVSNSIIPLVTIKVDEDSVCALDDIHFSALTPSKYFKWYFGDGDSSTAESPTHAYSDTGNYSAILKLTNECGNSASDTMNIRVGIFASSSALFNYGGDTSKCSYESFNLTASKPNQTYSWTFDNGYTSSDYNPTVFYTDTGTYTVKLITTNGCSKMDSSTKKINVKFDATIKPSSSFTLDDSNGGGMTDTVKVCKSDTVRPNNNSWGTGLLTYKWYFGDGDSSTAKEPNHAYTANGIYTVQLIVTSSCNSIDTSTKWVNVTNLEPGLVLEAITTNRCPGEIVYFFNDSAEHGEEDLYIYDIWYGDGDSLMNITKAGTFGSVAEHAYASAGTYVYELRAENLCGNKIKKSDTVKVYDPNTSPSYYFTNNTIPEGGNSTAGMCPNDSVTFYALGAKSVSWDFGDGSPLGSGIQTYHVYASTGSYTATGYITNGCGTIDSMTTVVLINNTQTPDIGLSTDATFICNPDTVSFSARTWDSDEVRNIDFSWDFGDGNTSTASKVDHIFTSRGAFSVTLTGTNGCGNSDSRMTTIIVDETYVTFSGLASSYCIDDGAATLTGSPAGGVFSGAGVTGSQFNPGTAGVGDHTVTYTYTNTKGCVDSYSLVITVYGLPNANAGPDAAVCAGGSAQFNATGGVSYNWSPTDSLSDPNIANPVATPIITTNYVVQVTDINGCIAGDTLVATVEAALVANAGIDISICLGDSVRLNASGGGLYLWSGDSLSTVNVHNPWVYPIISTSYILAVSSGVCLDADTVVVTVDSIPVPFVLPVGPITVCAPATVALTAYAASTYSWNTGETTSSITVSSTGQYWALGTDANGCSDSSNQVNVTINPEAFLTVTPINELCFNSCDGMATTKITGGTSPFTYSWSNDSTTKDLSSLCVGTYTATITDTKGCKDTVSATVGQPSALTLYMSVIDVSCNGVIDGIGIVSAAGGTSKYTYSWETTGSTNDSSTFGAGTYHVTVTDANNCTKVGTAVISEPTALDNTMSKVDVSCKGGNNGMAITTPSGGTIPYSYAWNGSAVNNDSLTGLIALTFAYTVTVTDANGCAKIGSILVNEPTLLTVSITDKDVSCKGGSDGEAVAAASGGNGGYTYSWSDVNKTKIDTLANVLTGTYNVTATDSKGCVATNFVTVIEPAALVSFIWGYDVSCNGGSDGEAWVSIAGGNSGYSYNWSSGSTNDSISGLIAMTYEVTVTDAKGCVITDTIKISEPNALNIIVSITDLTCNKSSDGEAGVEVNGGTIPYAYLWSPDGDTTASITGKMAGLYSYIATDANGCILSDTVEIREPDALSLTISSANVLCNAACDGWASVDVTGGTSPWTYSWDDGLNQATMKAVDLCAATYMVNITDANFCEDSASVVITQPQQLTAFISDSVDLLCFEECIGSATLRPNGGTMPYYYWWNDWDKQMDTTATGLCVGVYEATVSDANSCWYSVMVEITEPSELMVVTSSINSSCGNSDGQATVSGWGGTGTYVYKWNDAINQTTATANSLAAGAYNVTVMDNNGCWEVGYASINDAGAPTVLITGVWDVSCFAGDDGSISASAYGGTPPFSYLWSDGASQTTDVIMDLMAGNYAVEVTDSLGCLASANGWIDEPDMLAISISAKPGTCFGSCDGEAFADVIGGTMPYTYWWNDSEMQDSARAISLCAGNYDVTVVDANGCWSTESTTITEPTEIILVLTSTNSSCGNQDGKSTVSGSGGTGAYTYSWSDASNQTTIKATNLSAGAYNVTVMDENGCWQVGYTSINDAGAPTVMITNVVDVSCNSGNDGEISASASGGSSPYTYQWNDASNQTGTTAGNLNSNNYAVVVTDSLGCKASENGMVNEPDLLEIAVQSDSTSCYMVCDGWAVATVTGGTNPYNYLWSDWDMQTSATVIDLCADNYNVTVMDANGCWDVASTTISEPSEIVLTLSSVNSTCGNADGQAAVTATGGTGSLYYKWNDATNQSTETATNLLAGAYNVTVMDDNNCGVVGYASINDAGAPSVTIIDVVDASCNGDNDGKIFASVSGGTPPYSYIWNDGANQTGDKAVNIIAGNYAIEVTDSLGCLASANATVLEPDSLLLNVYVDSSSCFEGCDGIAYAAVWGGTGMYSYSWDDDMMQTDSVAIDLCAGNYEVTVIDENGCWNIGYGKIEQPSELILSLGSSDANCGQADGSAVVSVMGGMAPYQYMWNDTASQTTALATNLFASNYAVMITDDHGCIKLGAVAVNNAGAPDVSIIDFEGVLCFGGSDGSALATAIGGTKPYQFIWTDSLAQTGEMAINLSADLYFVQVTDSNNCISFGSIEIMEPEELSLWLYKENAHCGKDDGGALVMITGGTMPYNILWDDDSTQTLDTAFSLYSRMYHVYVDDSNGCATDDSIMVYDIDGPTLSVEAVWDVSCYGGNDGSAEVSTIDGTEPFMYMWSDGQTTEDAWSLMMGDHYLTVTDDAGCMAYDTVSVSEPEALQLSMKSTDVKCNGVCDGSLVASVSGGTLPYNYTWNDTLGSTSFTFGLCAGNYTLSVVDANGCIVGTANLITEPDLLVLELDSIANSGGDIDDGMAIATVTGGVTPYSYLWDDPSSQATDTASGLFGFVYYTVIITDSNGCVVSDSIYVDQLIGINQLEGVIKFNIYPNPSKGLVTIEVDLNNDKATELIIMNETGQLVYKTELNNTGIIRKELDLGNFSKGIYQIKIITNQSVITRQLFLVR